MPDQEFPDWVFEGPTNVPAVPNRDAAIISYNLLTQLSQLGEKSEQYQ